MYFSQEHSSVLKTPIFLIRTARRAGWFTQGQSREIHEFRLTDRRLSAGSFHHILPFKLLFPYQCNLDCIKVMFQNYKKFCLPRSSVAKGSKFEDTDMTLALSASFCSLILCVSLSKFFSKVS